MPGPYTTTPTTLAALAALQDHIAAGRVANLVIVATLEDGSIFDTTEMRDLMQLLGALEFCKSLAIQTFQHGQVRPVPQGMPADAPAEFPNGRH